MHRRGSCWLAYVLLLPTLAAGAFAEELCQRYGPQAPRDISSPDGANPVIFSPAPPADEMNLCNVHFHKPAEHKGPGFDDASAGNSEHAGFQCERQVAGTSGENPRCGNVLPGDTIEAHWVYTTCDVEPGPTLESCSSPSCVNPQLRVLAQVFVAVAEDGGVDFATFEPFSEGAVAYSGSTTGPDFDSARCSQFQVSWAVQPECVLLDIDSLDAWCADKPPEQNHAHDVRPLVTAPELLSKIQ